MLFDRFNISLFMNNIQLAHVASSSDPRLASVHYLYTTSFPEKERRPWEGIMRLIDSHMPFFRLFVAENADGQFLGFVSVWQLPGYLYIEHFAVAADKRSSGIGAEMLTALRELYPTSPLVAEVELPGSSSEADRRISFYERNGFTSLADFEYYQPPYAAGLPDVQLMLMSTAPISDPIAFTIMLHTLVYNQ